MYRVANAATPESLYAISRAAFAELALFGATAVGEFHYLWHQPDGTPYDDRLVLADAVIRAARDVGLRIALLRVLYHRAGAGRPAEDLQRRFCDPDVDLALSDVEDLAARYADDEAVSVGVAPHSLRAVPASWVRAASEFCAKRDLSLHMHVAEQPREIDECLAEHGRRPIEFLDELGVIGPRFVAVHATHLTAAEASLLARATVCVCRTTERNLGDGLPDLSALREAGARFCVGADSHARSDPFEELRAMELDERSRTGKRVMLWSGTDLLRVGQAGYAALGLDPADTVELDLTHPSLAGWTEETLDDAIAFGSAGAVASVTVAGRRIAAETLPLAEIQQAFRAAIAAL